ncbi:MAG: PAS domain S-box protein [Chloroflexi bacterium]|nr:PAS domain S-box protein [Chloroflexota bacterium]
MAEYYNLDASQVIYWLDMDMTHRATGESEAPITGTESIQKMLWRPADSLPWALLDSITDYITVLDTDLNIIWVNNANRILEKLFGTTMVGKKCYQAYHDRADVCPDCPAVATLATGEVSFEGEHVGRLGRIVEMWVYPVRHGNGNIEAVILYGRDITERKQAQSALEESEEKFRSLVNNVKLGIFRSTPGQGGRFLEVNPAMTDITGYSHDELLGMNVSDLYVNPTDRKTVLKEVSKAKGNITNDLRFRKKDGTEIIVSDTKVPVRDNAGKIIYFDGIMEDITDHKKAEQELRKSRSELRNLSLYLQRAIEEERKLTAREIHDRLGQPLTALKIDLSWVWQRLPPNTEFLFDKIRDMLGMIDRTIQIVKSISTQLRPAVLDDIGLAAAIEWMSAEFQRRTGIRCELHLKNGDLVPEEERDTVSFRILQEALTNIARHAQATVVRISMCARDDNLVLEINDNGKGIAKEQIYSSRAFGLIGMRERALSLGGTIEIFNNRGKGTTVKLSLPLGPKKEER